MTHNEDQTSAGPRDELGQTMVEYGLLVSLISVALVVVLSVGGVGGALGAKWANILAEFVDVL